MARRKSSSKGLSSKDYDILDEIQREISSGRLNSANEKLTNLENSHPKNIDVMYQRCRFLSEIDNFHKAWWYGYQIIKRKPDYKEALSDLINLSADLGHPWAAIHFIDQYQEHSIIMPSQYTRLRDEMVELSDSIIKDEPDLAMYTQDELARIDFITIMASFDVDNEVERLLKPLLKKSQIAKRLYNLRLLNLREQGKLQDCLDQIEAYRDQFPDDVFSISTSIAIHYMLGDDDVAQALCDDLMAREMTTVFDWIKRFEALAFLGQSERLIKDYDAFRAKYPDEYIEPIFLHYVATAYALTGDTKTASTMWRNLDSDAPTIAYENLSQLQAPIFHFNGFSYFDTTLMLPTGIFQAINQPIKNPTQAKRHFEKQFKKYPWLENVFTILLQRGDLDSRDFVLYVSRFYQITPALKEFALGKDGVDQHRLRALRILIENGHIEKDELPDMWMAGEWQKPHLLAYDVVYEPNKNKLSKTGVKLLEKAHELLNVDNDAEQALAIIEKALKIDPEDETLMHFKFICLKSMRELYEADKVLFDMIDKYPDYLFARLEKARYLINAEDLDEAEECIAPIKAKTTFHVSELKAYGITMLEFLTEQHNYVDVVNWANQLEAIEPSWVDALNIYREPAAREAVFDNMLSTLFSEEDS